MATKYYLDRRVLVRGKPSHIKLDNWLNLNSHILQVVGNLSGTTYTFDNGLTEFSNHVQLGGDLVQTTNISGLSVHGLELSNMFQLSTGGIDMINNFSNSLILNGENLVSISSVGTATSLVSLVGSRILVDAGFEFILQTPGINNNNRLLGSLLQVQDVTVGSLTKGLAEYTNYSFPIVSGTDGEILRISNNNLQWQNINDVLYFNDNPSDTIQSGVIPNTQIDLHAVNGNEFVNDGSYVDFEASLRITNYVTPFSLIFTWNTASLVDYQIEANGHISVKGRIYRVNSSEYLSESFVTLYEPVRNKSTDSEVFHFETTLPGGWANSSLDLRIAFTSSNASQQIELLHFAISKHLL